VYNGRATDNDALEMLVLNWGTSGSTVILATKAIRRIKV
jgi:hypothetical protein